MTFPVLQSYQRSTLLFKDLDPLTIAIDPNFAKAGGLQSPGVKGEAVVVYRDPFTTQDLKSSGFPAG